MKSSYLQENNIYNLTCSAWTDMWSDDLDVAIVTFLAGMGLLLWPLFIFQCILPLPRQKETPTCGVFLSSWVFLSIASACLWHFVGREPQALRNMVDENRPHGPLQPWTAAWRMPPTTSWFVPSDENELRDRLLHDAPRPVRVVGSSHSWSATSHTPGTVIDIRNLNRVKALHYTPHSSQETSMSLRERAGTITVQAGMKVRPPKASADHVWSRRSRGALRVTAGTVGHGGHGGCEGTCWLTNGQGYGQLERPPHTSRAGGRAKKIVRTAPFSTGAPAAEKERQL